jgi:hypothetical protein
MLGFSTKLYLRLLGLFATNNINININIKFAWPKCK